MSEELKIKGTLLEILPVESGTSKAGKEWRTKSFVIETEDKFPKKICCGLFGDKVDLIDKFEVGTVLEVKVNIESREFNGKWFTSVNAWFISGEEKQHERQPDTGLQQKSAKEMAMDKAQSFDDSENDLPF